MRKALLCVLFAQTQVGLLSFHLAATGIRESQDLEFRAEFFNLVNHPSFAQSDPDIIYSGFHSLDRATSQRTTRAEWAAALSDMVTRGAQGLLRVRQCCPRTRIS